MKIRLGDLGHRQAESLLLMFGINDQSSDHIDKNVIDIDSIAWDLKNPGTTHINRVSQGGSMLAKVEGGFRIAENIST